MDRIFHILHSENSNVYIKFITLHSSIEPAMPAPYPLIYPSSFIAPNSRVYKYNVPNRETSLDLTPHDNIPIY